LFADEELAPDIALAVSNSDSVTRALQSLTPRERACVVLHHMEQLRVREVADQLGIAEGTVKRYLSDAVAKLERDLGPLATRESPESAGETTTVNAMPSVRRSR
jgi:RNA polymerase sigma-70 factor (ECF subfamily)